MSVRQPLILHHMAWRKTWIFLVGGIALAALFVFWRADHRVARLREDVRRCEASCLSLSNSLVDAHTKLDWNRLQWYYAFREIEVEDHEAWRQACRKMDSEIASISNSLGLARERLASQKSKLTVAEQ